MNNYLSYVAEVCGATGCEEVPINPDLVTKAVSLFGGFILTILIVVMAMFGFWVWMLIDVLRREEEEFKKLSSGDRTLWLVMLLVSLIMGLWFVVAVVYYFVIFRTLSTSKKRANKK
jgi:hypothetical protein